MKVKNWGLLLLAVLLVCAQIVGASAEAVTEAEAFSTISDAMAAGREVSYSATLNWANPSILDEQTNAVLEALLKTSSISGRMASSDDGEYTSFEYAIDGNSVFNVDSVVYQDGTSITSSPLFGRPISINYEDLPQYFENLTYVMEQMPGYDEEQIAQMSAFFEGYTYGLELASGMVTQTGDQELSTIQIGDTEIDLEALMASLPIEAFGNAIAEWAASALVPEVIEGNVESLIQIDCAKSEVYTVEKEDLLSLSSALAPVLAESDNFISLILELSGVTEEQLAEQGMTMEDMVAQYKMIFSMLPMIVEGVPDGFSIACYSCYDAEDNVVLNIVRISVPNVEEPQEPQNENVDDNSEEAAADDNGEEAAVDYITVELEWTPDSSAIYAYVIVDGDGIEFTSWKEPTSTTEQDDSITTDELHQLSLLIIESDVPTLQFRADLYNSTTESKSDSSILCQSGIAAGYYTEEEFGAIEFACESEQSNVGQDLMIEGTIACILYIDEEVIPICTMDYKVETGDPQGSPLNREEMDILYPGKMNHEEYADWFNNELMPNIMKTGLYITSQLPEEVFSTIMIESEQ